MKKLIYSFAVSSVCLLGLTTPTFAMSNFNTEISESLVQDQNEEVSARASVYVTLSSTATSSTSSSATFNSGHATLRATNNSSAGSMTIRIKNATTGATVYSTSLAPNTSIPNINQPSGITLPADGEYFVELSGSTAYGNATLSQ